MNNTAAPDRRALPPIPAQVLAAHAPRVRPLHFDDPSGEVECPHASPIVVCQTKSNGTRGYFVQCRTCGDTRGEVAHAKLPPALREAAPPKWGYDHPSLQRFKELTRARRQVRFDRERQADYDAFRTSHARNTAPSNQEWQRMRRFVLARAGNKCEAYLDGCEVRASQVHHLRYNVADDNTHVGGEPAWDLRAVCRNCHESIHGVR